MGSGVHARVRPDTPGCTSQADTPPDDITLQGAYERHRDRVFDLCYHYLGQVADAEDAVQETFARAARRLPSLTGDRGAYLLAVARNLCCNELRRRRRVVPVESIDREDRSIEAERGIVERAVLERLWDRLSPRERSLIHDTFAGFSQQEIAGRVGLSPNAVAVALLRARQRARTYASRALAALFPLALAWRWTQRAARRAAAMPAEASSTLALQIQQVGMVLTAAIVGALAVSPALTQPASLVGARTAVPASGAGLSADAASPLAAGGVGGGAGDSSERAAPPAAAGPSQPSSPVSVLDPIINPGKDAPQQDVAFNSITPSPNYQNDHTVFASGTLAKGCPGVTSCPVLYRSNDGGATWTEVSSPTFGGGRILLPAAWPQDPFMLAMGPQGLQKSTDGVNFTPVLPVQAPAAVVPGTRAGGAEVLIATNPMLVYSEATNTVSQGPALPAGLEQPTDVAYVGDAHHLEVTSVVASGTDPVTGAETGAVVQCVDSACSTVATTPGVAPLWLTVSPRASVDHAVAAFHSSLVLRSVDAGASFTTSHLPVATGTSTVVTYAAGGSPAGVLATAFSQRPLVLQLSEAGTTTQMPSQGLPTRAPLNALVALGDGRLLVAASMNLSNGDFGLLCLAPGRASWVVGC